jgi:hypothetical protein
MMKGGEKGSPVELENGVEGSGRGERSSSLELRDEATDVREMAEVLFQCGERMSRSVVGMFGAESRLQITEVFQDGVMEKFRV